MKRALVLLAAVFLTACQTMYEGDENSPYFLIPAGSRLTLTREITIPADQLAVYLQGGQILPRSQLNLYIGYCKFELRRTSATPRTVSPDEFTITGVRQNQFYTRADYMQFADQEGGFGYVVYSTIMDLRSDRQPDVFRLTCEKWNMPIESTYVSISEMRRALGGYFTLRVAPGGR